MSTITVKRAGELLRSVFEVLWDKPEGMTAREVLIQIPRFTKLTEEELKPSLSTHIPHYEKIVRIASIPVTQAGWLKKNKKGLWCISQEGYEASARFTSVQDFYQEALRLYDERRRAIPEILMTLEMAQEAAWAQIKKHLYGLNPRDVQTMLAGLLYAMNYYPAWMAPPEKHNPKIDMVAYTDPLGANGRRLLAQIKHKGQPVTLEGIRGFVSMLHPNDFGMILSISGFTNDALQDLHEIQKVTVLDAAAFYNLWETYYGDLDEEVRRLMPLKAVHFLAVTE